MKKKNILFWALAFISAVALAGVDRSNTFTLGNGSSSNKQIVVDKGSGSTNPKIKWNNTNSRFEFTNDGTNFSAFGSGSGGSAGINLLTNGDFEQGTTEWTASAGSFAVTTTAANVGGGLQSGSWTPAASTNTLTTDQKTILAGLYGRSCLAKVIYKKTANNADHTLYVIDGSSNTLGSATLTVASTYTQATIPFVCPTSGTAAVRITAG